MSVFGVCSRCFAELDSSADLCPNCAAPTLPEDRSRGRVETTASRPAEIRKFKAGIYPREFEAVLDRRLRALTMGEWQERPIEAGDLVMIEELDPAKSIPTGKSVVAVVTHTRRGVAIGIAPWIVLVSISIDESDRPADLRERFR